MKIGHVAWMVCCLGLASVFLVNCGNSSPSSSNGATATPTPATSSTAGHQLYAFVLANNGSGGVSMVAVSGPYSNTGSSAFSFTLPTPSGTSYIVAGFFDVANSFVLPTGTTTITPNANNYGQQYPNLCISTNTGQTFYSSTQTGIAFTMSVANNACTFGAGANGVTYSPATGSGVVLSGTISQTGL
jgi:hypothetical protein